MSSSINFEYDANDYQRYGKQWPPYLGVGVGVGPRETAIDLDRAWVVGSGIRMDILEASKDNSIRVTYLANP